MNFEEIDEDGDGLISFKEIKKAMTKLKRGKETREYFEIMDYQNTKEISYEEFIKSTINRKQLENEENIIKCFHALDSDNNGHISIKEFKDISYFLNDPSKDKQIQATFKTYSSGKHYVRLISYLIKIF